MESIDRVRVLCHVTPTTEGWCPRLECLPDGRTLLATRSRKVRDLAPSSSPARAVDAAHGTDPSETKRFPTGLTRPASEEGDRPSSAARLAKDDRTQCFVFDGVLRGANSTVDAVFSRTVGPLLSSSLLRGVHTTLISYGEGSSGKSGFLFGDCRGGGRAAQRIGTSSHDGVAQRAVRHIFQAGATAAEERRLEVTLLFLQFYGDNISDLLAPAATTTGTTAAGRPRSQRGDAGGRCAPGVWLDSNGDAVVRGVTGRICATEADAQACVSAGCAAWQASPHCAASSVVLRVTVRQQPTTEAPGVEACCAHLHLVDLVGTQRLDDGMSPAQRLAVQTANKSLATFEHVLNALASASHLSHPTPDDHAASPSSGTTPVAVPHVPYRQSKLTTLLRGYIGLHTATLLLAHVVPAESHFEATLSTLGFAKRLLRVPVTPVANTYTSPQSQVRQLQRALEAANAELRLHAQLQQGQPRVPASGATGHAERQGPRTTFAAHDTDDIEARVNRFLSGSTASVDVRDVREMRSAFVLMRAAVEAREEALVNAKNELEQRDIACRDLAATATTASSSLGHDGGRAEGAGNGRRRSTCGAHSRSRSRSRTAEEVALDAIVQVTPSTLDTSHGIGYGTASRPAPLRAPQRTPAPAAVTTVNGPSATDAVLKAGDTTRAALPAPLSTTAVAARAGPPPPPLLAVAPHAAEAPRAQRDEATSGAGGSGRPPLHGQRAEQAVATAATNTSSRPPTASSSAGLPRPRSTGAATLLASLSTAVQPAVSRPATSSSATEMAERVGGARHRVEAANRALAEREQFELYKATEQGQEHLQALARAQAVLAESQRASDAAGRLVRLGQSLRDRKYGLVSGSGEVSLNPSRPCSARCRITSAGPPLTMAVFQRTASLPPTLPLPLHLTSSPGTSPPTLELPMPLHDTSPRPLPPQRGIGAAPVSVHMDLDVQLTQLMAGMTASQADRYVTQLQALHDACLAHHDAHARTVERRRVGVLQSFETWRSRWQASDLATFPAMATPQAALTLPAVAPVGTGAGALTAHQRPRHPMSRTATHKMRGGEATSPPARPPVAATAVAATAAAVHTRTAAA